MVGFNKFDTEKYMLETLDRISRNRSEYSVLYVNVSKLKPKNRHPRFVKIIARIFDDLVSVVSGTMFVLSNGDFAVLGKDISEKVVDDAVAKLRKGLITDPIWTSYSSSEFTRIYMPDDFDELYKIIEGMMNDDLVVDNTAYRNPLDAGKVDIVKSHLDEINIVDLIKHQKVLKLESSNSFRLLFEEFFVAVKDLSKKFDKTVDLVGNKWLFLYLTQTLDKKTMYSFMFSNIKNKPEKISLNLNLSTIFLPEFEDFTKQVLAQGQKIVAEVQVMDIMNNMPLYFDAREFLHNQGGEILIDATSVEMLQALNVGSLKPDFVKIFWHGLMEEYTDSEEIKLLINELGVDKIILAKCLDDKAVRWGIKNGIRSFQGPYIDALDVALTRSKCPNGKVCSAEECLKRKRLIAGSFRDECQYKDFLERKPG